MKSQEYLPWKGPEPAAPKLPLNSFVYEPDVLRRIDLVVQTVGELGAVVIISGEQSKMKSKLLKYPRCFQYKDRIEDRSRILVFEDCNTYSKIKAAEEYAKAGFQTLVFTSLPPVFLEYSKRSAKALSCVHTQVPFYKNMLEQSKIVFYRVRRAACAEDKTDGHGGAVDAGGGADCSDLGDTPNKLRKLDRLLASLKNAGVALLSSHERTNRFLAELYGGKFAENAPGFASTENMIFATFAHLRDNRRETGAATDKTANFVYFDFDLYRLDGQRFLFLSEHDKEKLLNWVSCEEEIASAQKNGTATESVREKSGECAKPRTLHLECGDGGADRKTAAKRCTPSAAHVLELARRRVVHQNANPKESCYAEEALIEVGAKLSSSLLSAHRLISLEKKESTEKRSRLLLKGSEDIFAEIGRVYSAVQMPIRILRLVTTRGTDILEISQLKLGHVSSPSTFSDASPLMGTGTLCLKNGIICIVYVTKQHTYKFTISLADLDPFVFVYSVPGKEGTYLAITTKNFFKVFYLCGGGGSWKRASIKNMPLCQDRFDIQFKTKSAVAGMLKDHFTSFTLMYSCLEERSTGLTLKEVRTMCENLPFEKYYYLECFLTQKGRFVANRMTKEDLGKMASSDLVAVIRRLNLAVDRRFVDISSAVKNITSTIGCTAASKAESDAGSGDRRHTAGAEGALVKSAVYTPFRVFYMYPSHTGMNRVLREFDVDKFIRFGFREENLVDRVVKTSSYDTSEVFDHYRALLLDGILVGKRRFFFLAMSSSQLRMHNAWFVTPYAVQETLIGPDFIRSWMGDFSMIKNIGKYAIRLGQVLSTTTKALSIARYREVDDITRNGYIFSDGIGIINRRVADKVAAILGLSTTPSVFQIRFAGYKGAVAVGDVEDDLVLRESMKKFESSYNILEIVAYSQRRPCYLNRQIIMILESLGIAQSVFIKMHDQHVFRALRKSNFVNRNFLHVRRCVDDNGVCAAGDMEYDAAATLGDAQRKSGSSVLSAVTDASFSLSEAPSFFQERPFSGDNGMFTDLRSKSRIFVSRGRTLIGVLDEMGVLEEEEVFVMSRISEEDDAVDDLVNVRGDYLVVNSLAIVVKNPCLHPGDLRTVRAVDVPSLYHMKECVVFSQKGARPVFNMCSGSDLDGDMYTISWDSRLIPSTSVSSDTYKGVAVLHKEVVSMTDIVNFYVRYMQDDQIGLISNAHLAFSDLLEDGVRSTEATRLATLFNMGIDFPKTGYVATLPLDLVPQSAPDYMESYGCRKYLSTKAVGKLYRRTAYLMFPQDAFCNCMQCLYAGSSGKISYPGAVDQYIIEGSEMARRYEEGALKNLGKHKNALVCNETRALAWHKAGSERRGHSLFPFLVEEFVDVERYTKAGGEKGVLGKVLCMIGAHHEPFILDKTIICIDYMYRCELDKIRVHIQKNLKKYQNHTLQNERDYFSIAGETVVLARTQRLVHIKNAVAPNAVEVLSELFMILVAMGFVSIEDFDNALSFVEFIVECLRGNHTREHLIEVLIKIASDFYSTNSFNLSEPFAKFLLFGSKPGSNSKTSAGVASVSGLDTLSMHRSKQPRGSRMEREFVSEHRSNSLLAAALLLSTPVRLRYKLRISRTVSRSSAFDVGSRKVVREKKTSPCRKYDIVVVGMFDEYEEVYLTQYEGVVSTKNPRPYVLVPNLLNFGLSSVSIYKDYLRKFIMGHVMHEASHVYARITPGVFYLYDIPLQYRNNNISIKDLKSLVSFGNLGPLKACFQKTFPSIEEYSEMQIRKCGLQIRNREECYILRLFKDKTRYTIYANHAGVVEKVAVDSTLLGCFQFVRPNTEVRCDMNIEIMKERAVSPSEIPSELRFLLDERVVSRHNKKYVLSSCFSAFSGVNLKALTYWTIANDRKAEARLGLVRRFSGVECNEYDAHNFMESLCAHQNQDSNSSNSRVEMFFEQVWENLCLLDGFTSGEKPT